MVTKTSTVERVRVPIPMRDLNRLKLRKNIQQFFASGGLRITKDGENAITIRSDPRASTFLEAQPVLDSAGSPFADAVQRLDPDGFGRDRGAAELVELQKSHGLRPPSALMEFQMELLASPDPLGALVELAQRQNIALWALRTTEPFRRRLLIFEIFEYLRRGNDPAKFVDRKRVNVPLVSGLVELQPASNVCSVLAARNQPLVAVLLTPFLSQVVLVPAHGAFTREASVPPWPVAFGQISMAGPRIGAYATPLKRLPPGHGDAALRAIVASANVLFDQLTRPGEWSKDGTFDFDGRLLLWGSVRFGLDAITALAADWSSQEAIWTAFRALTILQGIWDCQLSDLLNPDRLQAHVVPHLFDAAEQSWAGGLVENYRATLAAAFPGTSAGTAAVRLSQLRHLVHGMRAESKDPTARLAVLRSVETAAASLELIRDVATLWWTAVLLSPATHARPGIAPWARRPTNQPA